MSKEPRRILQLPPSVINKIAAGEVIERPASVLKELLENAVDSGADRIDARLEKGGTDRIRVTDNGCGIPAEELPLALASHATSKIQSADDLFAVSSLGFRGEALASIAEVSQLGLRSRTTDSPAGNELWVRGGVHAQIVPAASAPGTTVDVKNLFFNTPVRQKFMRTVATELGHATEAFVRIALAYPQVHFSLQHNERPIHELPPVDRWRDRIATVFGAEIAESLIWVESQDERLRLTGYVADPTQNRGNNKMQYLFLNGRHIRDRSLQHALSEAYRGLLLTGRYPITFLQFEMPPAQIDVNVHPTKLEVRFQDGGHIYSQLLSTIRGRFLSTDLTARVQPTGAPPSAAPPTPETPVPIGQAQAVRDRVKQWARQPPDVGGAALPDSSMGSASDERSLRFDHSRPLAGFRMPPDATATSVRSASSSSETMVSASQALQAHNRYLITASDEGLVIIDQHALHERILYEQLREKVLGGQVEVQRLLTPEPIDLSPSEVAAVLDNQEALADLGLEVDAFGGTTVLLQGYPAMLGDVQPDELLRHIASQLELGDRLPERRDVLDELLHMMSCKAAIKAGDPLSSAEIDALLEFRHLVQDSHHCPHGRPTTLVFTREELDRRFKRI